jgi:hypothetical protein
LDSWDCQDYESTDDGGYQEGGRGSLGVHFYLSGLRSLWSQGFLDSVSFSPGKVLWVHTFAGMTTSSPPTPSPLAR